MSRGVFGFSAAPCGGDQAVGRDDRLIELEGVRGLQHADRCRGRVARARDLEAADDAVGDIRLEQGLDRARAVLPGPERVSGVFPGSPTNMPAESRPA